MIPEQTVPTARWRRWALRAGLAVLHATQRVTPKPTVLLLRRTFAAAGARQAEALVRRAPADVVTVVDERYDPADPDALLDVYVPAAHAAPGERLATIVWTHGGAFVGGTKDELAGWFRILAGHGFTVVAMRYTLAPEGRFPTPVRQVSAALAHVVAHAERLHVDPDRLVLAGDSAGSHITAQLAAAAGDPGYAELVGVVPSVRVEQLRGLVLCCGVYSVPDTRAPSAGARFLRCVLWAYSGNRRFADDAAFVSAMSVVDHVTERFPATFLTVGNADPLLSHSLDLEARLRALGVDVETRFFDADHEPPLGHEYQFAIDLADAQDTLARIVEFARRRT